MRGDKKLLRLKKVVIKKSEIFFFTSYLLFLFFMTLSSSFYYKYFMNEMKIIILGCCLILVIGELINRKVSHTGLKGAVICMILFLLVFMVSKGATENAVAAIFLYIYCSRNISFEKIARFTVIVLSVLLFAIVISSMAGFIDNTLVVKSGRSRWCLGFRYVLYAPSIYFNIACLWAYLNKNRKCVFDVCILLVVNYWLYYMTDSRITFAMTTVVLLIPAILINKNENKHLKKWKIFIPSYLIFFFISVSMTVFYSGSIGWMKVINEFLSQRLSLGQASIIQNGIGLIGQKLTMIGNGMDAYGKISSDAFTNYTYVDSLYVQILIHYGVIFTALYLIVMTIAMYKCYVMKDKMAIVILTLIGMHCMIDDMQLYLQYNTFWLLVGHLLMNRTQKDSSSELERKSILKKKYLRKEIRCK